MWEYIGRQVYTGFVSYLHASWNEARPVKKLVLEVLRNDSHVVSENVFNSSYMYLNAQYPAAEYTVSDNVLHFGVEGAPRDPPSLKLPSISLLPIVECNIHQWVCAYGMQSQRLYISWGSLPPKLPRPCGISAH